METSASTIREVFQNFPQLAVACLAQNFKTDNFALKDYSFTPTAGALRQILEILRQPLLFV